jgi:hypothetical protein
MYNNMEGITTHNVYGKGEWLPLLWMKYSHR